MPPPPVLGGTKIGARRRMTKYMAPYGPLSALRAVPHDGGCPLITNKPEFVKLFLRTGAVEGVPRLPGHPVLPVPEPEPTCLFHCKLDKVLAGELSLPSLTPAAACSMCPGARSSSETHTAAVLPSCPANPAAPPHSAQRQNHQECWPAWSSETRAFHCYWERSSRCHYTDGAGLHGGHLLFSSCGGWKSRSGC